MKQSILRVIQETVMQYAKVIAQVIRVDVEIVYTFVYRVFRSG